MISCRWIDLFWLLLFHSSRKSVSATVKSLDFILKRLSFLLCQCRSALIHWLRWLKSSLSSPWTIRRIVNSIQWFNMLNLSGFHWLGICVSTGVTGLVIRVVGWGWGLVDGCHWLLITRGGLAYIALDLEALTNFISKARTVVWFRLDDARWIRREFIGCCGWFWEILGRLTQLAGLTRTSQLVSRVALGCGILICPNTSADENWVIPHVVKLGFELS